MSGQEIELSVVAPVYNEYGNLRPLTEKIVAALEDEVDNFEIVYVDDGSTDGSSELMDQLAEEYSRLRVYHFTENNGQTAAFAAAFEQAEGRLIATLDADLQVIPEDILELLPYSKEYDLVCGVRTEREDNWIKKLSSRIANGVRNWLTNEDIVDTGCPLKLFRREVVESYHLFQGMHRFFPTLAKMNGYSIVEVPVNHYPRQHGESKYGINNRLWSGLKDTLAVRWMQQRKIDYRFVEEED